MKKNYISIVQKCICIDELINSLIISNTYGHLAFLESIKSENLRNIKIICYLYESIHKDILDLDELEAIEFHKQKDKSISRLLQFNLEILNDLERLKKSSSNIFTIQFLNALISSYFKFVSLINSHYPFTSPKSPRNLLSLSKEVYSSYFESKSNNNITQDNEFSSTDLLRNIAIDTITLFFDYSLNSNPISDEHYEVFFENDSKNKFYQFFLKSLNRSFKVRIWDKDGTVFYIYQTMDNSIEMVPGMTQEDAKKFSNDFIEKKMPDDFNNLVLDENYLNIYSYMNIPESYKFKYNLKDSKGKVNLNKGLYITIGAKYIKVQEIYLL
ncbi:MAG: hypothetical protein RRZ84_00855 [Romboutsia sp.]